MNTTSLTGNWNEMKAKVQQQWSKFTDDDLGAIKGDINEVVGRLQKIYGYSNEKARQEFDEFKKKHMSQDHEGADAGRSKQSSRESKENEPRLYG